MHEANLKTIDCKMLMATTPPEPINFIVDTLLSQGLHPELSQEINQLSTETISPKIISKSLIQNQAELSSMEISFRRKRSNGKRLIELHKISENIDDNNGTVDPASEVSLIT